VQNGKDIRLTAEIYALDSETNCIAVERVCGDICDYATKYDEIKKYVLAEL